MAENLINYRTTSKDQNLYINGERIIGVQSASINKNFGTNPLSYAGIGLKTINYIPTNPQLSVVNINSYLLNKEFFLPHVTGTNMINAFIMKNNKDTNPPYSILNGYFNSYSCEYYVGQIPKISTSINVMGNAGKIPTGSLGSLALSELLFITNNIEDQTNEDWGSILGGVATSGDWLTITGIITSSEDWNMSASVTGLLIPDAGSISLNIDTFQTNRLQSYRIDVNPQKDPIYNMGNRAATRVDIIYPIDVTCQFTFDVGNYESVQTTNIPQYPTVKNLSLIVNDYKTDTNIATYSFSNLNLISENYNTSIDSNVSVTVIYNTKLYGN